MGHYSLENEIQKMEARKGKPNPIESLSIREKLVHKKDATFVLQILLNAINSELLYSQPEPEQELSVRETLYRFALISYQSQLAAVEQELREATNNVSDHELHRLLTNLAELLRTYKLNLTGQKTDEPSVQLLFKWQKVAEQLRQTPPMGEDETQKVLKLFFDTVAE